MTINVLLMCKNSQYFLHKVIKSWQVVGPVHVFVDDKTTDDTEKILRRLGVEYELFTFVDFATSRNAILSRFPTGWRVFIDDSYEFMGDPEALDYELKSLKCNVATVRLTKDCEWFAYSKFTRSNNVRYVGAVHEYINQDPGHKIQSCFIRDLTCQDHITRTLKRIPWDYELMLAKWYRDPADYRNIYYLARTVMYFRNQEQEVNTRLIEYWLIQLLTACPAGSDHGLYRDYALKNLRIMRSTRICA